VTALVLVALGWPGMASAVTCTWSAGAAGNWTTTTNWTNCGASHYPSTGDTAIFDGTSIKQCNLTADVSIATLTISAGFTGATTNAEIVSSSGNTLTVTGNYSQAAGRFGNQASGVSIFGGLIVGGTFTLSGGTFYAPPITTITGAFTQSNGTFTGNATNVTMAGDFNLSNGTFTAPAVLAVGGKFNKTGGTFTQGTRQLILASASSQVHAFGTQTFYNLTINDGMLGYWKLDETGTLATITDYSGYGNHLTARNTPVANTSTPSTIFYDPGSVTFAKNLQRTLNLGALSTDLQQTVWTISAWVKVTSLDTNGTEVLSVGNRSMLRLIAGTGTNVRVEAIMYDGSTYKKGDSADNSTITTGDGKWHHVAVTNNGTTLTAWVDGTSLGTSLGGSTQAFNGVVDDLTIGAHADYTGTQTYEMDGSIDEVRLYNRALTDGDLMAISSGSLPGSSVSTQTVGGTITVTHDLTIASGTLNDGGTTITLGGSWRNFGGLLSASGTVAMSTTGTEYIDSNHQWFSTLTLSSSGSGTFINRDLLSVAATLNLQSGTLQHFANDERYKARFGTINQTSGSTLDQNGLGGVMISTNTSTNTFKVTSTAATLKQFRFEAKSETGLMGYWKLDEQTGTSTFDNTSSANTGTLTNGARWQNNTYDSGYVTTSIGGFPRFFYNGGWVLLDGSNDYVSLGTTNLPVPNATQSISLWVYYDATTASQQNFYSLVDATAAHDVHIGFHSSNIAVWKSGGTDLLTYAIPAAGSWYHVVYTYDSSTTTHKLYVGGTLRDTETGIAADTAGSAPYYATIGAYRTSGGTYSQYYAGRVDDVRVYNVLLTAQQVTGMNAGRWAGTGSTVTWTLSNGLSVPSYAIDAGTLATSTFVLATTTGSCSVASGILQLDAAAAVCLGNPTVYDNGKLIMKTGATWKIDDQSVFTVDGTLESLPTGANPVLQNNGTGTFLFKIGSSSTATPTLNISGLDVKNVDSTTGMWVNATAGAQTVVRRFEGVKLSSGDTEASSALLRVDNGSNSFYMNGNGCTFDRTGMNATSYNVKIMGDSDTTDGEARAVFGSSTCKDTAGATEVCESADRDDDNSTVDGVADTGCGATAGCGVVQFVYNSYSDTTGNIAGFPTSSFNWSGFAPWMTYVAFNNVSSGVHRLYARNADGSDAGYYWDIPASRGTFVGTPRWDMENTTQHFVYVLTSLGYVYKLRDFGSSGAGGFSILTADIGSANYPYQAGGNATGASPLAMDSTNVYWSGYDSNGSTPKVFAVVRSTGLSAATAFTLGATAVGAPALASLSGVTTFFVASSTGTIYKLSQSFASISSVVAGSSITGPLGIYSTGGLIYGTSAGTVVSRSASSLSQIWIYTNANASSIGAVYYENRRQRVLYGDAVGKMYAVTNGAVVSSNYPYQPTGTTTSSDPITIAPIYVDGVSAYGTTTGKVVFIDAQNASNQPALIQMYNFGSAVSSIAYEYISSTVGNFMIGTDDGRLHFIRRDTSDSTTMRDPTTSNL
jgi:hypothetical protein